VFSLFGAAFLISDLVYGAPVTNTRGGEPLTHGETILVGLLFCGTGLLFAALGAAIVRNTRLPPPR